MSLRPCECALSVPSCAKVKVLSYHRWKASVEKGLLLRDPLVKGWPFWYQRSVCDTWEDFNGFVYYFVCTSVCVCVCLSVCVPLVKIPLVT